MKELVLIVLELKDASYIHHTFIHRKEAAVHRYSIKIGVSKIHKNTPVKFAEFLRTFIL